MPENESDTLAGPANNPTELLPPTTQAAPELAWADDDVTAWTDDVDPSWRAAAISVAPILFILAAITAIAVAVGATVVLLRHESAPPAPAPVSVIPAAALPHVQPTPDPDITPAPKTITPTPIAAPPPMTVTREQPPPPKPSAAELDERYLADLTAGGLRITDVPTVLTGARNVCRFLKAGHTEADAVQVAMNTNATLTQANAATMVDSAIAVYCPGMGGGDGQPEAWARTLGDVRKHFCGCLLFHHLYMRVAFRLGAPWLCGRTRIANPYRECDWPSSTWPSSEELGMPPDYTLYEPRTSPHQYVCAQCGSLVQSIRAHDAWHSRVEGRGESAAVG